MEQVPARRAETVGAVASEYAASKLAESQFLGWHWFVGKAAEKSDWPFVMCERVAAAVVVVAAAAVVVVATTLDLRWDELLGG